MKQTLCTAAAFCALCPVLVGQAVPNTTATGTAVKPAHVSIYLQAPAVDFIGVLPPPPNASTRDGAADLAAVHDAEAHRTVAEVQQARRDDGEEDIFIFATVLGSRFNATSMPLTAALGVHVRNEAGTVTPLLKAHYARPRPFVADSTLHPVCEQKREPSYPSGHAMVGYLEALTVAQMVPERAADILARADAYAHSRVICGVHYPSDTAASRAAALVEFGALAQNDAFRIGLAQARDETRRVLGLPLYAAPLR